MKKFILLTCCIFLLVGCQPSAEDIEKAIAQTQEADQSKETSTQIPVATPEDTLIVPTFTSQPTITKQPTAQPTKTSTPDVDTLIEDLIVDISDVILEYTDVESITTIRKGSKSFEIEVRTMYASKDRQPDVSFQIIKLLAEIFGDVDEDRLINLVEGDTPHFSVSLTTYSVDGDYKYSSLTYYDSFQKLFKKQITYEEWVEVAGAGFVE
jgi:hypothetical protein